MATDIMPIVKIAETGEPMADSRDVAAFFGKQHFNVLQAIRNLDCSQDFRRLNFQAFKINDLTGESTSHVMMTKDGFTFLAMGFTGERAAIFKERYIAAFNAMAARPAVPDFNDPEVLQMHLLDHARAERADEKAIAPAIGRQHILVMARPQAIDFVSAFTNQISSARFSKESSR